jgi:hypothetical protein
MHYFYIIRDFYDRRVVKRRSQTMVISPRVNARIRAKLSYERARTHAASARRDSRTKGSNAMLHSTLAAISVSHALSTWGGISDTWGGISDTWGGISSTWGSIIHSTWGGISSLRTGVLHLMDPWGGISG